MAQPPHVLVIRRRYLGDLVLLGPVFRNLRRHWPDARLVALAEPAYAPILGLIPEIDETLALPPGTAAWPGFVRRLRRQRFTHVLDLDNTQRTALLTRFSGAPFRLALWHRRLIWPRAYTHRVHVPVEVHAHNPVTDYYLAALEPVGVPVVTREVSLTLSEAEIVAARQLVPGGRRTLLLHPGSRSPYRLWPAENFAQVCDRVQDELGVQVFVMGGPGEQALVGKIREQAKTHLVTINAALSLPQFAALAARFDVMLCHDSGPMHVAAAVGTRVVALLGSQDPVLFAPAGPGHIQLQPPLPCTHCVAPDRCVPGDSYHNYCVRNITVEQVIGALRTQFRAGPVPAQS